MKSSHLKGGMRAFALPVLCAAAAVLLCQAAVAASSNAGLFNASRQIQGLFQGARDDVPEVPGVGALQEFETTGRKVHTVSPGDRNILDFTKTHKPENVLVLYAKTKDGRFLNPGVLEFYWRMDSGSSKQWLKRTHPKIVSGVRKKLKVSGINDEHTAFSIRLAEFDKMAHDIPDPTVTVSLKKEGADFNIHAVIRLGPSANSRLMRIETVYAHSDKSPLSQYLSNSPPDYIRLSGVDAETGKPLEVTYKKK